MNTMTLTKVVAGFCGSFLIFLLGKWLAEEVYHVESHGQASYVIDTGSSGAAEEVEEVSFEEMLASADIGKGERVFRKCSACHKVEDGANGTGPHLYSVVDRAKAGVDGFSYSAALAGMGGDWTVDNLNAFLERPSDYVSGTSMSFAGLRKVEERANVIAYLQSIGN